MPSDFYWLVGAHPTAQPPSTFILSTTSATAPARRKKTATEQVGRLTRWLEQYRSLGAPLVGWSITDCGVLRSLVHDHKSALTDL